MKPEQARQTLMLQRRIARGDRIVKPEIIKPGGRDLMRQAS